MHQSHRSAAPKKEELLTRLLGGVQPEELKKRFESSTGISRRMFDHLIEVARHPNRVHTHGVLPTAHISAGMVHPLHRPDETCYTFLALLLTSEPEFAALGKERLRLVLDDLPTRETSNCCQLHTWCDAFPMARYGIYLSWLKDLGHLTEAENLGFREQFLSYCRFHPFERLRVRYSTPDSPNNQNGSMGLACIVTALMFRKENVFDPRVRDILNLGLEHVIDFVTGFPIGGYSGEGSGYNLGVNALLIVIGLEVLESATSQSWLYARKGAAFATPHETLLAMVAQSSRSGLSFPWDDYGYMRAKHAFVGSYLSWKTGETEPLRTLFNSGAVFDSLHVGWGFEHRLWTLMYCPSNLLVQPKQSISLNCANPTTHAVLESESRRLHLLHIWDSSEWLPIRSHCNPGSITAEFAGVPLIVEGRPWIASPERYSASPFTISNRYGGDVNIGRGSISAHNCIVIDGEDWFAPQSPTGGKLQQASWLKNASYACSDLTEVYAHYGLNQVSRETLMLGDELILIRDSIESQVPHTYRWVAHVPPGKVDIIEGTASYSAPQGLRLDFTNNTENTFIVLPTGRCNEISYEVTKESVRLLTTLSFEDTFKEHLNLSAGWELAWAGSREEAQTIAQNEFKGESHNFSQGPWFYTTDESRPGWVVLQKTFTQENIQGKTIGIRFPRHATNVQLELNGKALDLPYITDETELTYSFIDCSDALQPGSNTLRILADSSVDFCPYGKISLGSIEDHKSPPLPNVYWHDEIEYISIPNGSAQAQIYVHQSESAGCAFNVINIESSFFNLETSTPIDVSWSETELSFGSTDTAVKVKFSIGKANGVAVLGNQPTVKWESIETVEVLFAQQEINRGFPSKWTGKVTNRGMPRKPVVNTTSVTSESIESIQDKLISKDWKDQVLAMDAAHGIYDANLIEAVLEKLQWEIQNHPTSYEPDPEDPAWYRIKAAAARYLGSIRYEPAVPLLAKLLQQCETIYPPRVAAACALNQIHSQEARSALIEIDDFDEFNVAMTCRDALEHWNL